MIELKDRLIYALDADDLGRAREWVARLRDWVGIFKIGFQLFLREGPGAVEMVHEEGCRVFLDLKFHDIPHTVAKAASEAAGMGVYMFNVHAAGGRAMMEAAKDAAGSGEGSPLVLGVTMLTSLDGKAAEDVGFCAEPAEMVTRLCDLARTAGLAGVVASPLEAAAIREKHGPGFRIVCPGVRPAGSDRGDQARVATPEAAIRAGADHLVVGRPIRDAKDPEEAARAVLDQIRSALDN